jgi:hypothetical protein
MQRGRIGRQIGALVAGRLEQATGDVAGFGCGRVGNGRFL